MTTPVHEQNQAKVDEVIGLADLGVLDEREFERRITVDGGSIHDAQDDALAVMFNGRGAGEGYKAYLASLTVARGWTACGCEHCQAVEAYAKRWSEFTEQTNQGR